MVELYATYEDATYFYIVIELCSGGDLFQNLATRDVFLEQDAAYISEPTRLCQIPVPGNAASSLASRTDTLKRLWDKKSLTKKARVFLL